MPPEIPVTELDDESVILMSEGLRHEIAQLEKLIDRTLAKLSSVITISGLFTFVSLAFTGENKGDFLSFYLIWIFPYLLIGFIIWILILKYSSGTFLIEDRYLTKGHKMNPATHRQLRLKGIRSDFQLTSKSYRRTRRLFGISLGFIVAYLANYTVYFYLFYYSVSISIPTIILVTVLTLLLIKEFVSWYNNAKKADSPIYLKDR